VPGHRQDVYQLRPNVWKRLLLLETQKYLRFCELTEQGQNLLDKASAEGGKALQEMADLNGYLAEEAPRIIEQWQRGGSRSGSKRGVRTRKDSNPHAWEL